MKRNLSNLTSEDIYQIILWVRYSEHRLVCPFGGDVEHPYPCQKCRDIFPKLDTIDDCPCDISSVEYVTRVAKKIVREWEAKNDIPK